jgi:hypothetical protein
VLAINRLGTGIFPDRRGSHIYWVRFAAFALILLAILN